MTEQSIGDMLNDEPIAEAPVEAPPAVETPVEAVETPPETVERPRGPDGKFISKGETDAVPPPAQDETGHIPIAALKDERSKRQALENELAQLRQQMQQPQPQPTQAQPEGPPDQFEDPEGYTRWLIGQASAAAREEAQQAFQYQRIQHSAEEAKAKLPDYAEKISVFQQMVQANPVLQQEMQRAPNPAQYAYDTAKIQMELQQHGGLEGLIEARLKARQAEAMQAVQGQLPQSAPPTISTDRSVGARSGPAWSGPGSISDYLK